MQRFFDEVQSLISAGIRPEEVGYQVRYSKHSLRKIIKEYSLKEVRRGVRLWRVWGRVSVRVLL
jgi:exocyst complex component 1